MSMVVCQKFEPKTKYHMYPKIAFVNCFAEHKSFTKHK